MARLLAWWSFSASLWVKYSQFHMKTIEVIIIIISSIMFHWLTFDRVSRDYGYPIYLMILNHDNISNQEDEKQDVQTISNPLWGC